MLKDDKTNFRNQYKKGKIGEMIIRDIVLSKGGIIQDISEGNRPERDIKYINSREKVVTMEIKTDYTTYSNVPIEIESRNKLSGVYSTKANIYTIVNLNDSRLYYGNTAKIKNYIETNLNLRSAINKQNDSKTKLILIPKHLFNQEFNSIAFSLPLRGGQRNSDNPPMYELKHLQKIHSLKDVLNIQPTHTL